MDGVLAVIDPVSLLLLKIGFSVFVFFVGGGVS